MWHQVNMVSQFSLIKSKPVSIPILLIVLTLLSQFFDTKSVNYCGISINGILPSPSPTQSLIPPSIFTQNRSTKLTSWHYFMPRQHAKTYCCAWKQGFGYLGFQKLMNGIITELAWVIIKALLKLVFLEVQIPILRCTTFQQKYLATKYNHYSRSLN